MRKLLGFLIAILILGAWASQSYANVSSAAVLFLRIAAGARAAGMGEAFVAVADDATATHWNPAGLGAYPLSSKWFEIKIPDQYRPLKRMTLFKGEGSELDYRRFDIWGISPQGLVRYTKNQWTRGEVIETSPQQTMESIARQYTGLTADTSQEKIGGLMNRIARANNPYPPERLDTLKNGVMSILSPDYKSKDDLEVNFVALAKAYSECLINWENIDKAFDEYRDGKKDSVISEAEADKILFSLEKAKRKFLPATLTIPFDINFEGRLNDLTSNEDFLWVASESGLYRYNGRNWQKFSVNEGLPTNDVKLVKIYNNKAYLGTDKGLVVYNAGAFVKYGQSTGLPEEMVDGVAAVADDNVWALVDSDLYHFDGKVWKNYIDYNDILGQNDSSIYETMKIYGTPAEREKYLAKFAVVNTPDTFVLPSETAKIPPQPNIRHLMDSAGVVSAYRLALDTAVTKVSLDMTADPPSAASKPGKMMKIPYVAGLNFVQTDMDVDGHGGLWIGTEYGLLRFDGRKWARYGYRDFTPDKDMSVMTLALERVSGDSARAQRLAENVKTVNDLSSDMIKAGQTVKLYSNPAGSRVNEIRPFENQIYFATEGGTIYFDGQWSRYNAEDLGRINTTAIEERGENIWFASSDRIFVKAGARSELSMMHVNWLPELANDIYYEFISYVKNIEGWGTVGGNFTILSYGKIVRTGEGGENLGDFSAFDAAFTLSYGTSLSPSLSTGISAKLIMSHLSSIGAGKEKGSGTSTGLALDVGMLYRLHRRATLGMAITNIGPDVSYIDVSQADPLPRNLAVGLAWRMIESNYSRFLITVEANKSLVGITGGSISNQLKEVILNGGAEYWYASFIALRAGYIYDQEGEIKTPTLGLGLAYRLFQFDFAYIPSNDQVPLANTMRFSLSIKM